MKTVATIVASFLFLSCVNSKETNYTASTPAGPIVRTFLEIPLTDSIDFIRWKILLNDVKYTLECNYGIGKPNTNGFYDGGKKITLTGTVKKNKHNYILQNGKHVLKLVELNNNLLHILNDDNSLLIGSDGWSYAINNIKPTASNEHNIRANRTLVKDSMAFVGRTPCGVPGVVKQKECYKLKWYLVLYGNPSKNEPTTYRVLGTAFRAEGGRKGTWKIINNDGKIIYQLYDEKQNSFIRLLKLDDGVLIFSDATDNLLVGDLDFSYTLNRRF